MDTHAAIQGNITSNGFTMYRLTALSNMQLDVIQAINQNAMR